MSRSKLFINNFLVYGFGSIISKAIPLIILPIITNIMTDTKYYGINDMVNLVISFASAIALMGMYDAMFRMFFEREDLEYKKIICSTALFWVIVSSTILCVIMTIFKDNILNLIINDTKDILLFFIIIFNVFLSGIQNIVSAPTRMQNKSKVFLITNSLPPIFSYSISIPMLLSGQYVYALPFAALISNSIMVIIFFIINREWFSINMISIKNSKILFKIGLPLMPTFLMLWVCSSFDRIMIKTMLDLNQLGIYSVANKISQISQFINTAFTMGWQYFVFATMNDDDQKKMISNAIEYLLAISSIATIIVGMFSKWIFSVLARGDYMEGYIILPYLFVAPLLLMIFQTTTSQLIIRKKTYPIPIMLILAVIVNFICNYLFIPIYGISGAAIATVIGYIVAVISCYFLSINMNLIIKNNRFIYNFCLLGLYIFLWKDLTSKNLVLNITISVLVIILYVILYKKEIRIILGKLLK